MVKFMFFLYFIAYLIEHETIKQKNLKLTEVVIILLNFDFFNPNFYLF